MGDLFNRLSTLANDNPEVRHYVVPLLKGHTSSVDADNQEIRDAIIQVHMAQGAVKVASMRAAEATKQLATINSELLDATNRLGAADKALTEVYNRSK